MRIEVEIERFIVDELMMEDDRSEVDPNESLIDSGLLDSIAVLRLVAFLEEKFDITVEDSEVNPDNFETVNGMKAFLERKMQNNGQKS